MYGAWPRRWRGAPWEDRHVAVGICSGDNGLVLILVLVLDLGCSLGWGRGQGAGGGRQLRHPPLRQGREDRERRFRSGVQVYLNKVDLSGSTSSDSLLLQVG